VGKGRGLETEPFFFYNTGLAAGATPHLLWAFVIGRCFLRPETTVLIGKGINRIQGKEDKNDRR
jgi:hypothetical protein